MTNFEHQPVLLAETCNALIIDPDGVYVDVTFGRGGHSAAILERLSHKGKLFALDQDPEAAVFASHSPISSDKRFQFIQGSFAQLKRLLHEKQMTGLLTGIFADLGVSSPQLDDSQRGFSFQQNGPLDMRMDNSKGQTAADWLASAHESDIADVIWLYGEERFARRIARAIVYRRAQEPIQTTDKLVNIIRSAMPSVDRHKHPATRTFQAIRLFVNQELESLQALLDQAPDLLMVGGRLCTIAFHSLEDRLIKRFLQAQKRERRMAMVGKPIKASEQEQVKNPRARSAIMRVGERLNDSES